MPRNKKAPKGTVAIRVDDGRLYLRWTWSKELGGNGRRYEIALGLPDTEPNHKVAGFKAKLIERDMATENFDPTCKRYRSNQGHSPLSAVSLFEKFIDYKAKHVYQSTLINYNGLLTHFKKYCNYSA